MSAPFQIGNTLELAAEKAMRKAADYLTCLQERDGHWCAELTADTTLESDYILFQLWLYPPVNGKWTPDTRPLIEKAVVSILERQLPDGGFNIYAGGPSEVSASVKAYLALKLAGVSIDSDRMQILRERILVLGGIQAANSYVKVNLSLFDLYPREYLPEHSARSRVTSVQPALPDVGMDARDCGFAIDRARGQSAGCDAGRLHAGRTLAAGSQPGFSP